MSSDNMSTKIEDLPAATEAVPVVAAQETTSAAAETATVAPAVAESSCKECSSHIMCDTCMPQTSKSMYKRVAKYALVFVSVFLVYNAFVVTKASVFLQKVTKGNPHAFYLIMAALVTLVYYILSMVHAYFIQ